MAQLFANVDGTLSAAILSTAETSVITPPTNPTATLTFDPDANPTLVAALRQSTDAFRLVGSTLTQNGQAVTINAPSQNFTDRQQLATIRQTLTDYFNNASPTNAQSVTAIKALIRAVGVILSNS